MLFSLRSQQNYRNECQRIPKTTKMHKLNNHYSLKGFSPLISKLKLPGAFFLKKTPMFEFRPLKELKNLNSSTHYAVGFLLWKF